MTFVVTDINSAAPRRDSPSQLSNAGQQDGAVEDFADYQRARLSELLVVIGVSRDRAAFAELFRFYAPRVKSYAMRLGSDPALAEEIAQDVLITVWRKADMFDPKQSSPSTWIFRIARNRRIDLYRRSNKLELDPNDEMLHPAPVQNAEAGLEAADIEANVRNALRNLPPEQLETLKLAFYEGLSHREIANRLDLPLGTVKSRIKLAFQKMRRDVQPY